MDDDDYPAFLLLLDNSQLIAHINSFTESDVASRNASLVVTPTPTAAGTASRLAQTSFRSTSSNPFDDNLDSVLLKLGKLPSGSSQDALPPNQLALLETDTDDDVHAGENDPRSGAAAESSAFNNVEHVNDSKISLAGADPKIDMKAGADPDDVDFKEDTTFGDVGPQHKFGDYGTYFQNKYKKQQVADAAYIEWERKRRVEQGHSADLPRFFEGVVAFVNGNTVPTIGVVHKMVILYGGKFIHYLNNKSAATHIICDRLTPRKKIEFRNYRVVKAQWIADCVEKQTLLDWRDYRLIDVVDVDQQRLGFLKVETSPKIPVKRPLPETVPEEIINASGNTSYPNEEEESELDEDPFSDSRLESEAELEDEIAEDDPKGGVSQFNIAKERNKFGQMDAKHPDFLPHFFANSRLHHLSSWKADLRSKFLRLVSRETTPPKRDKSAQLVIMHIDFDCFFATASTLGHPELDINVDPIAVSHGGKSSDVASCNYVARRKGLRNGMWLGGALEICPDLIVLDYDFIVYEKISNAFYNYLVTKGVFDVIFPVLIDEVLVDATSYCQNSGKPVPEAVEALAQEIRSDIVELTGCPVSIGAGSNVLLAKLAIKKAKPNGQFFLHEDIERFLDNTKLQDIPGIGWKMCEKLADELQVADPKSIKIGLVKNLSLQRLSTVFGEKTGKKIYDNCRGVDLKTIELDLNSSEALLGRKTVSVDVNFGIRFDTFDQAERFLMGLAKELHSRLIDLGVCGTAITLKLARRAPGAPVNPPKYLGMGRCDFFSKSSRMGVPTNDWGILGSEMKSLFRMLNIPVQDLRGIAVSISKLEDIDAVKKQRQQTLNFNRIVSEVKLPKPNLQEIPFAERVTNSESIDWEVFNQLPEDIRQELKQELRQRGISVSGKERSPSKGSPRKGGKAYIQQLFPTQPNGDFKHVRVKEAPAKKKRQVNGSPVKVEQPKSASPTPFDDTVSYDEDVLNEIPSSIRNEFMENLTRIRKNKKLGFVSIKQKLEQKQNTRQQIISSEINSEWLSRQPKLIRIRDFGLSTQSNERADQLKQWVSLSMESEGPHPEDVRQFGIYLRDIAEQGNINLSASMFKVLENEVQKQDTLARLCSSQKSFYGRGLDDWKAVLQTLRGVIAEVCQKRNIELDL